MSRPFMVSEKDWQGVVGHLSDKFKLTETAARAARDNLGWGFEHGMLDSAILFTAPSDTMKQLQMFRDSVAKYAECSDVIFSDTIGKYIFMVE